MNRFTVFLLAILYWHGFFWGAHLLLCAFTGVRLPTLHLTSRPFQVTALFMGAAIATVWRAN